MKREREQLAAALSKWISAGGIETPEEREACARLAERLVRDSEREEVEL